MDNLFIGREASAFASTSSQPLGFVGVVSLQLGKASGTVVHECLRYHDQPSEALEDARRDAQRLIQMADEMVRWGD
jgi:hypothetical protein